MSNEIVRQDIQSLINQWMELERNGVEFPVPFESAWPIAGYATKGSAKRSMTGFLSDGRDFVFNSLLKSNGGRSSQDYRLSCDAFKELCMLSRSAQGKATREYFIDAEKKWKLVGQVSPEFAQNIEVLKLKIELAKQEAIKAKADETTIAIRQFVVTTCPEVIQQKILGYSVVEKIEYRDRVLHNDDLIRDGGTLNKTEMCRRLNFKTRSGAPDYKALNKFIAGLRLPSDAWKLTATIRENEELKAEYWQEVESQFLRADRNFNIGE